MSRVCLIERVSSTMVLFFLLVGCILPCDSHAQGSGSLSLSYSTSASTRGSSYGDNFLEYKSYGLSELLLSVYDGYIYNVESDSLAIKKFDFRWKGTLENRANIIEDLNYALSLNLGVEVNTLKESPDVYFLKYNGKEGCPEGSSTRISKINRLWQGKCVTLKQVANQVREWYSVNVDVTEEVVIPEIDLHHDDLEIFLLYLRKSHIQFEVKKEAKIKFIYK